MALIVFKDKSRKFIAPKKALALWNVFNGNEDGTKEQRAYVDKVQRIFLNWHTAPDDYKRRYGDEPYTPTQSELMDERYK